MAGALCNAAGASPERPPKIDARDRIAAVVTDLCVRDQFDGRRRAVERMCMSGCS